MKKLLSLILVLAMLFCVCAACASKQDDPLSSAEQLPAVEDAGGNTADPLIPPAGDNTVLTKDELLASKPNEYIQEKLDAGIEVRVVASFSTTAEQILQMMDNGLREEFEKLGIVYSSSDAQANTATQIQQMENFMEMAPAAIIAVFNEVDPFETITAQCIENGSYVVTFSSQPYYEVSGYAILNQADFAEAYAVGVSAYLDYKYPDAGTGEVKAAFLSWGTSGDLMTFRDTAYNTITANEPRLDIVFYDDNVVDIDGGYNAAQAALTYDPAIRVFLITSGSQAVGANNYITTIPGADLDEYAILTRGISTATLELLENGKTSNGSVVRMLGGSGFGTSIYYSTFEVTRRLLFGEAEAPYPMNDRYYIDTTFGYYFDSEA